MGNVGLTADDHNPSFRFCYRKGPLEGFFKKGCAPGGLQKLFRFMGVTGGPQTGSRSTGEYNTIVKHSLIIRYTPSISQPGRPYER